MDDLKVVAQTLVSSKRNLIEEIKSAMRCLASVEEELKRVKTDAMSLQSLNKEIETEFTRIEQTYFTKKPVVWYILNICDSFKIFFPFFNDFATM